MKTTFINTSKEKRTELRKVGRQHLESRADDFRGYMEYGTDEENLDIIDEPEASKARYFFEQTGQFYEYGLAVDYVTPGTFKNKAGYLRYQLSYGGPSEEVRFYFTPNALEAYKIEFVYLDWGVGVGFDVTNEDWAKWLFDWFNEVGTVEAEVQKAFND